MFNQVAKHKKQDGFSTMQVVAALAIAGVITAAAASVLLPAYQQTVLNAAFEEISVIAASVRQVREYNGDYSEMTNATWLVTNGYISDQLYDDGANENRLGNDFTVAPVTGNNDATITYTFDSQPDCEAIADRVERAIGGLTGTDPACVSSVLTITLN